MAYDPIHGWRGPFQPEPHANGYRFITCKGKKFSVHSIVAELVAGEWVSFDSFSEAARRLSSIYNVDFFANNVGRAAKQHKMYNGIKLRTV